MSPPPETGENESNLSPPGHVPLRHVLPRFLEDLFSPVSGDIFPGFKEGVTFPAETVIHAGIEGYKRPKSDTLTALSFVEKPFCGKD